MAGESVNFLRRQRQQALRFQRLDRRILQVAIGVSVVSVAVTVGIFVFSQVRQQTFADIQSQQRTVQSVLNQQANNEANYLLFFSRLNILQDIIPGRSSQREAMEFLGQLLSSDIAFDRINYDDNAKTIIFRVKAQNVLAVEKFLDRLRSPETRERFFSLVLSDVKRDEGQIYSMEITVQLEEPARPERNRG